MTLKTYIAAGLLAAVLGAGAFAGDSMAAGAAAKPAAGQPAAGAAAATPAPASSTAGLPQDASTANRPATQNWLKVCDPIPAGQKGAGQQACILRQIVVANNQFLGSFLLRDDPGQESRLLAVAAVPLGVLLPFGLTWQIDSQKPIRVPFMLCDPVQCSTQLVINEQYIAALKKGATLSLVAKSRANKDIVVQISLAGFGPVYDGAAAMTFDQARKQATDAAAGSLQQGIDDRAEQLRKQMDQAAGSDATPAAPADGTTPAAPASK